MITLQQARAASERLEADLMRVLGPNLPGTRNLAIALDENGELYLRLKVERGRRQDVSERLPKEIDGVKIRVETEEAGRKRIVRYDATGRR